MMEKMDPLKKALSMRRGQGIDIKIIVGEGEEENEQKTDKAPKPAGPLAKDEPMKEMAPEMDPELADMDKTMIGEMSEYDKEDLMSRKPKSLGERARVAAMERMKK